MTKQPRDPSHSAALEEAFEHAIATYDDAFGPDALRPDKVTAEQLAAASPEARRAWAHLLFIIEISPLWKWDKDRPTTCGWCVRAAGNDQAAHDAAEVFESNDAHREHVLRCEHMPLVARVQRLRGALNEALDLARDLVETRLQVLAGISKEGPRAREVCREHLAQIAELRKVWLP